MPNLLVVNGAAVNGSGTAYTETELQSIAASACQVASGASKSALLIINGNTTSQVTAASALLTLLDSSGNATYQALAASTIFASLASSGDATTAFISGERKFSSTEMSSASAQAAAIWYLQKFSVANINPAGSSIPSMVSGAFKASYLSSNGKAQSTINSSSNTPTNFGMIGSSAFNLNRQEIKLSSANYSGQSAGDIRGICIVDFMDQSDGMPRPAEVRQMDRGPHDSDMKVYPQVGMTRATEEREMVAP